MKIAEPRRGEIWWVDWSPGRGSEQIGRRPALVIQVDAANRNPHYPNTVVLTISSKGREVPFHVTLAPSRINGLHMTSYVHCEQIMTISKDRLEARLGQVTPGELAQVEHGMRLVVGI
ncbi:MAG TPA: type II toxin-antitoxin system PemK/MazF family toxin [Armatimonadota bacterium]